MDSGPALNVFISATTDAILKARVSSAVTTRLSLMHGNAVHITVQESVTLVQPRNVVTTKSSHEVKFAANTIVVTTATIPQAPLAAMEK